MRYEDENVWLTQKMMGLSTMSAINQHLKRIFVDNELTRQSTGKKNFIVQTEDSQEFGA